MSTDNSTELVRKIDTLTRLVAISVVNGKKQREQVRLLSLAGMAPSDIAALLGTTSNTVNVALSALRKEKRLNLKSEGDGNA